MSDIERSRFGPAELPNDTCGKLEDFCTHARGNIIRMTSLAESGHPGGSMSSLEIFALLYSQANIDPLHPLMNGRDRIIVSHGHTSPGVYSTLGGLGFFNLKDAVVSFRKAGSPFEGHIERTVPGIELTTGNLGQGVSAGAGMALADRLNGISNHVWIVTGDGEHQKGQIAEARRFIKAHALNNITVVVDCNGLQISGSTDRVMYTDIAGEYRADGWDIIEVNGHDIPALYKALKPNGHQSKPRLVLAKTVMGKSVSFMENDPQYHGKTLTPGQADTALKELGEQNNLPELQSLRQESPVPEFNLDFDDCILASGGVPKTYSSGYFGDNRSAFGNALLDLAESNTDNLPIVFDCDLSGSVKTKVFAEMYPGNFFQSGIMEHNTATAAGAASIAGKVVFWADFGVFAADETFNQHRINDINETNLNTVATHCGLDVGMDGKTHQCIDYINLIGSLPNTKLIVPADPNQTDRAVRYAATHSGNFFIAMGRSKLPIITDESGNQRFAGNYNFEYGIFDRVRTGTDTAILTFGSMLYRALEAKTILERKGISTAVYNVSSPTIIPPELLLELQKFNMVLTYEDHNADTGLGARVALELASLDNTPVLLRAGVKGYGMSGDPEDLYRAQGLLPKQIAKRIETYIFV